MNGVLLLIDNHFRIGNLDLLNLNIQKLVGIHLKIQSLIIQAVTVS